MKSIHKTTAQFSFRIDLESLADCIAEQSDHGSCHDFIMEIDRLMADAGFTENLVKSLVKSMRDDLYPEEFDAFLKSVGLMTK